MNLILLHCFFAWLCAQGMKVLLCYWNHSFKLERCVGTGGMSSSHSSTVCCLAASIAMQDGFLHLHLRLPLSLHLLLYMMH